MKSKNCLKAFTALLCIMMILPLFGTAPASANSAMTWWEGTESSGVIITDRECPVVVESELLTFNIQDFPSVYYQSADEYIAYSSQVTAEYTFYNPGDYAVTAKLLFPFGCLPAYGEGYYDDRLESYTAMDDTEKFDITVNGRIIEKHLRHTLLNEKLTFQLEEDIAKLRDGYIEDEFYYPEMPVTKYTYAISGIDKERYPAANAAFDVPVFNGKRKLLFADQSGQCLQKNNTMRISAWANYEETMTLYVIGAPFDTMPQWKIYKDGGTEDGAEIPGNLALVSIEKLTFKDLAFTAYSNESGIIASDWYNAAVANFNGKTDAWGIVSCTKYDFDISDSLMRWYEYEIHIDPGERIVNAVTAPMYPTIDQSWNPFVYGYTYLLSPAKTWTEFGSLEIVIHTPYYMTESGIEGFMKTETGYRLALTGLPDCELTFTLSTEENPKAPAEAVISSLFRKGAPLLGAIVAAFLIVFVLVFVIGRKKR